MPVTLAMRCAFLVLLFYLFLTACNPAGGGTGPAGDKTDHAGGKTDPATGGASPIDPTAQLIFTKHAKCRMDCRHITAKEIHEILDGGTINYSKSDPDARPDPKYAVEGYTREQQHLRIIVAPEGQKLIVITCIELGVEWTCHCN